MKDNKNEFTIDFTKMFEDTKLVLKKPKVFFTKLKSTKGENKLREAVLYFVAITLVGSVISLVYSYTLYPILTRTFPNVFISYSDQPPLLESVPVILVGAVVLVLLSFIWSGILHAWFRLFRGKGTFVDSYQVFAYSRGPLALLGWLPFIGNLTGLYSIYIMILGIREFHGMSAKKAALVMIPLIIALLFLQIVSFSALSQMQ